MSEKMNSTLYSKDLMKRMSKTPLSANEMFMMYFLSTVIKNQMTVFKAFENLEIKSMV